MNKIISLVLVLALIVMIMPTAFAETVEREYGIYTRAEIEAAKDRIRNGDAKTAAAFDQFKTRVDGWCMARESHAMEDYYIKGYYVDATAHITASKNLTHDAYAAYATALAWQLTGEDKYAEKARALLNGWAQVNKTFSLQDDTPLVAAYGGVGFIYAAELISEYSGWTSSEQSAFKTWVKNLYEPAITSIVTRTNNWGSWGVLACLCEYHYLNDTNGVNRMASRLAELIGAQINSKGQLMAEIGRGTNGMWYTYFSLAPLTQAAQIAYNLTGRSYYDYVGVNGGSITKALNNYLPYVQDPTLWDNDYKAQYYSGQNLNRPHLSGGSTASANWPANLYEAMGYVYGENGEEYKELVQDYEPIMGGWTEREAHHLAWSFPSLIPPTVPDTENNDPYAGFPEYIEDDFEGYSTSALGSPWDARLIPINGSTSGLLAEVADEGNGNHAMRIKDTAKGSWDSATQSGSGCTEVQADLYPAEGPCQVEFDIKVAGTSAGTENAGVHVQDVVTGSFSIVSFMYKNGNFVIKRPDSAGGSAVEHVILTSPEVNRWYKVKMLFDTSEKSVDVYIDGTLVAENQHFRSESAAKFSRIKFTTDSGADNTDNYFDNVYAGPEKSDDPTATAAPVVTPAATATPVHTATPAPTELPAFIEEDFEGYDSSALQSPWDVKYIPLNGSTAGLSASVAEEGSGNHAMRMRDTAQGYWDSSTQSGTGCVEITADMNPTEGPCLVEFDIKVAGTKSGTESAGVHVQDVVTGNHTILSFMYVSGNFVLRRPDSVGGSAVNKALVTGVEANRWYNVKMLFDINRKSVDVYIDNTLAAENQHFRSESAAKLSRIKFATDSGANNTDNYFDNIYAGPFRYEIDKVSLSGNTVNAAIVRNTENADFYAAAYDSNDVLTAFTVLNAASNSEEDVVTASGTFGGDISGVAKVKVFAFEKSINRPLCTWAEN